MSDPIKKPDLTQNADEPKSNTESNMRLARLRAEEEAEIALLPIAEQAEARRALQVIRLEGLPTAENAVRWVMKHPSVIQRISRFRTEEEARIALLPISEQAEARRVLQVILQDYLP